MGAARYVTKCSLSGLTVVSDSHPNSLSSTEEAAQRMFEKVSGGRFDSPQCGQSPVSPFEESKVLDFVRTQGPIDAWQIAEQLSMTSAKVNQILYRRLQPQNKVFTAGKNGSRPLWHFFEVRDMQSHPFEDLSKRFSNFNVRESSPIGSERKQKMVEPSVGFPPMSYSSFSVDPSDFVDSQRTSNNNSSSSTDVSLLVDHLADSIRVICDQNIDSPFIEEIKAGLRLTIERVCENWGLSHSDRNKLIHALNGNGNFDLVDLDGFKGFLIPWALSGEVVKCVVIKFHEDREFGLEIKDHGTLFSFIHEDLDPKDWINLNLSESLPKKVLMLHRFGFPSSSSSPFDVAMDFLKWVSVKHSMSSGMKGSISMLRKLNSEESRSSFWSLNIDEEPVAIDQSLGYIKLSDFKGSLFRSLPWLKLFGISDHFRFAMKIAVEEPFSKSLSEGIMAVDEAEKLMWTFASSKPIPISSVSKSLFCNASPFLYELIRRHLVEIIGGVLYKKEHASQRVAKATIVQGPNFNSRDMQTLETALGMSPDSSFVSSLGTGESVILSVYDPDRYSPESAELLVKLGKFSSVFFTSDKTSLTL
jgi:hypothetical protein